MDKKGFTLIEIVMVIILLGILGAIIGIPLIQGARGWLAATTRIGITESGRVAMERMVREIRNMETKEGTSEPPSPCIATATASTLQFSVADGDLTNCNSINFSLSGSEIQRNGTTMAKDIQSLTISYYDNNNSSTATIADIRRLSIEIVAEKGGETKREYSEVYLQNTRGY
jgi:prepilin-type N-terminal cleavage/methylation domain-containing protein